MVKTVKNFGNKKLDEGIKLDDKKEIRSTSGEKAEPKESTDEPI